MLICRLDFPDDLHYLVEHQVWARLDSDDLVTVGISAMGIHVAGEIYMCRPKPVGALVEAGRSMAVVELAKSIVSVKSPVHGSVTQINTRLQTEPELVHLDPYGAGWIVQVRTSQWAVDCKNLLRGQELLPAVQDYARLYLIEP